MGADEAGTLFALKAHRKELIEPKLAQYHGRTVKLMGDGALMEFGSVVDAVAFAVEVQTAMQGRNAGVPEDRQIVYRVGINIGDIIVEGDDIYGDGVNVAARLEGLAEPGGIFASRTVINHVKGKVELDFEDLGDQEVKNIAEPVGVYRVILDAKAAALATPVTETPVRIDSLRKRQIASAVAASVILIAGLIWWQPWGPEFEPASVEKMALSLPDKPSIAVLPFDNMSGDAEQDYFSDGMTEDLITDLSKVAGLFVIARNSTFTYKGKPVEVRQVAEDLGVRYVLEGSVRRAGDEVRINAQLIDALSGYHVWAERYDGFMANVFDLQDKVIRQIVAALAITLTSEENASALGPETEVPEAYDAFLQGWEDYRLGTFEGFGSAAVHFEKAIELDPSFGRAYAALARTHWKQTNLNWDFYSGTQWQHIRERGMSMLAKALEFTNPLAYAVSAEVHALEGRHEEALAAIDRAIALAPGNAESFLSKAVVLNVLGRAEEAEDAVRTAMRLNPHFRPDYLVILAESLFNQRRHEEAAEVAERVVKRRQQIPGDYLTLVATYGHLGRLGDAAAAAASYNEKVLAISYTTPISVQETGYWWYGDLYSYHEAYREHLQEGVRKAGVREGVGTDLAYNEYRPLISKDKGVYSVEGATKIDAATAKSLHERGLVFVDVRDSGSFDLGHVPGAHNLDLNAALNDENLSRLVAKDEEVVLSCWGEHCPWAAYASAKAVLWGFTQVYYFAGGFPEWKDAGYPVETGSKQ
jgi:TolB-like protein/rhodanese-related sulfurtransferase